MADIKEFTIEAKKENFEKVDSFLESNLEEVLNMSKLNHLFICMDEILSNITNYAYKDVGQIKIILEILDSNVSISTIDTGPAYNPLENKDPDVSLALEDRGIGGLGIFMVKKLADDVYYKRENNQNILTITINR